MSSEATAAGAFGPVAAAERVTELDVLRGVALFGVFLMNMVFFASTGYMATEAQLLALPTVAADFTVRSLVAWLVADKANTLFAFLFGLGFWLQLERATARGAAFERIYLRRLTVLLAFGLVHFLFLWTWDILHLYALAGFLLFALRRVSDRVLLVGGLALAVLARIGWKAIERVATATGDSGVASPFTDEAILARQALSDGGDYGGLVGNFANLGLWDWLGNGLIFAWLAYALGRFMIGAWVGRRGWLQHAAARLPAFRRVLRLALPAGLIAEGIALLLIYNADTQRLPAWPYWELAGEALHFVAAPVLATGYLCAIVTGLHHARWRRWLAPFGESGRMALTNYVGQSLVYAFVLFGVGPGLALAGRIGTVAVVAIVVIAYAAQVLVSGWWLARFRYGPLEWLWRGLTYGRWPAWRRAPAL